MNLFDFVYDRIYFPKEHKIRFFEAFSGIGCQAMALKKITDNFEIVGISEIDKYALQSYKAIHGEIKNYGGIGSFERLPKDIDICTWSFPCQDISPAGKQKGMVDGTRSNYGYEFLNTVDRTTKGERPKVLIMENIKALFSNKFKKDWREIQRRLEKLGYMSYAQVLSGKDYGLAQNRKRIFIVSVMGEYNYVFPEPKPLTKRLKDYLEDNVDEKYYLNDKQIEQIKSWKAQVDPLKEARTEDAIYIQTITAKSNTTMNSSMILIKTKNGKYRLATPRECWRLMGISDEDFDKAQASGMSNAQLYKQAGNGIVVDVFEAILAQMIERKK